MQLDKGQVIIFQASISQYICGGMWILALIIIKIILIKVQYHIYKTNCGNQALKEFSCKIYGEASTVLGIGLLGYLN